MLARFLRSKAGATAMEYGLIMALIACVLILALSTLGTSISTALFNKVSTNLSSGA